MGLQGVIRGKPIRTTVSDKAAPCPLDHVNRQFRAPGFSPNEMSQTPPYPLANNVFDALIVHDAEILHRLAHASRAIP
jgi:hypothetical protein